MNNLIPDPLKPFAFGFVVGGVLGLAGLNFIDDFAQWFISLLVLVVAHELTK